MKNILDQIPNWNDKYLEELKILFAKLENVPNGPLRDYILDDCLAIATAILNKVLSEGNVGGFNDTGRGKLTA